MLERKADASDPIFAFRVVTSAQIGRVRAFFGLEMIFDQWETISRPAYSLNIYNSSELATGYQTTSYSH